ncbi:MAG TPA: response regulator [Anaerolineales bacterium]
MKSIWIVDDDEEMSRAISLYLGLMDCEATSFLNARTAAQALLTGRRPELLLLDINMPEVTGLDLLEFIRRGEWCSLPVLMLSSEATDVMIDRALEIGADGYMTKPITYEELETAISRAFQKNQKGFTTHV